MLETHPLLSALLVKHDTGLVQISWTLFLTIQTANSDLNACMRESLKCIDKSDTKKIH